MTTIRTAHAAATPAARALALLANYRPVDADDAANLLAALHEHGSDTVIARLLEALDAQASNAFDTPGIDQDTAKRIAAHLNAAGELISGASSDWIDRAREVLPEPADTSEYDGVHLEPVIPDTDTAGSPADGWVMLTVPAREIREGDLLALSGWRRVTHAHYDREDRGAYITYQCADGRAGTLESIASEPHAILRRAARPDLADLARLIYGDADTLICGAALTRTAALYRIRERAHQLLAALDAGGVTP